MLFPSFGFDLSRLSPVMTAVIENALTRLLYQDVELKMARATLSGKVLSLELLEVATPLYFVFSKEKVDVLNQWDAGADCTIKTKLTALRQLKDKQKLSELMNSGDIVIYGDMQVVQHCSMLMDLAQWDIAHYLSPYFGDVIAEGISVIARKSAQRLDCFTKQQKHTWKAILFEEWKIAPTALEYTHFSDNLSQAEEHIARLEQRFLELEKKL